MSCRSGCFCTKKSLVTHSNKTSSCSKPISVLKKGSSTKSSSQPLYYRGGGCGSGYSKPSAPQSKIVSGNKPSIKTKKVALSKPASVILPGRSGGSSSTKPSTVQSAASSGSKPSGKTNSNSAISSCCGGVISNTKPSAPLSNTPIEKTKQLSTKPSSIASASNPTKHCIASQNTRTSPPSTMPKNSTKSSVVVKITVRTPQTTIEQETAFDIDS